MSNDLHLDGDFTLNIPHLDANFTLNEQPDIQADFIIETGRVQADFKDITGDPYDNSALAEALNQKADNSTVEELSETVDNNYNTLDTKIDSTQTALENDISALEADLNGKINNEQSARIEADNTLDTKIDAHIADKTNPHEVTKSQVGLSNVDNTSDLNKPISTATQTALNGKQNTISDLSEIRTNAGNGQSAYNTIQTYGNIVTYNASSFATSAQGQKADTAIQTVKVNGTALTPDSTKAVDVTVPAQVQADWDETNTTNKAFIKNKPTIPTVPTNISAFNNDSGYITEVTSTDVTDALGYTPYNSSNPDGYTSNIGTVTSVNGNLPDENGNVTIQGGGGGVTVDNSLSLTSENPVQNKVITQTFADFSSSIYIDSYLDSIISGNYSELPIVVQSSYNNDLDSIIGGTYVNV